MGINTKKEKQFKQDLAKNQGYAYEKALKEMQDEDIHDSKIVDDYIVSLACEKAEGMYMYHEDELVWMIPQPEENQHVEIVVQDKDDLRFIPGLDIFCQLKDASEKIVAEFTIPFIWHPFLFHYGINCTIPHEGIYTLTATIKKPTFHRHDEEAGKRYQWDVTVVLGPVTLVPGRKEHGAE